MQNFTAITETVIEICWFIDF